MFVSLAFFSIPITQINADFDPLPMTFLPNSSWNHDTPLPNLNYSYPVWVGWNVDLLGNRYEDQESFFVAQQISAGYFYYLGDSLYSSVPVVYTTYRTSGSLHDYLGWEQADCNGGTPENDPCTASAGLIKTQVFDNVKSSASHNVPIYSDSTGTTVHTPPQHGFDTTTLSINWQQPNFRNQFTSPDFEQWWLCVTIPQHYGVENYKITIRYGKTSNLPTWDYEDDTEDVMTFPVYTGVDNACHLIDKQNPLTPDNYSAVAGLWDADDDILIAQTPTITFTITDGEVTQVPYGDPEQSDYSARCENYTNTIRKLGCQLMVGAFFPSDNTLNKISELKTLLSTKIPSSYFLSIYDVFTDVSSSSTDFPTLTLDTTSSAVPLEVDMLSESTINEYVPSGTLTMFRGLVAVALYLLFFSAVVYQFRNMFRKQ